MNTDRDSLSNRLDELGKCWNRQPDPENDAVQTALFVEICTVVLALFSPVPKWLRKGVSIEDAHDILMDLIMEEMRRQFDPDKGTLSNFIRFRLKNRIHDQIRSRARQQQREPDSFSLDQEGADYHDLIPASADRVSGFNDEETTKAHLFELTAQIIHFKQRHTTKTGNNTRLNYYRLFFTSNITSFINAIAVPPAFQHERDLFEAMKLPFVDFCMVSSCRTIEELCNGQLKRYGQVVDLPESNRDRDNPIPLPIPDKVGISYLFRVEEKQVTPTAYSQQKKHYRQEVRQLLLDNNLR